ncbi:MAG: hypothetical protein QW177_04810 [Candidatus Nitrosotenuis sp.]
MKLIILTILLLAASVAFSNVWAHHVSYKNMELKTINGEQLNIKFSNETVGINHGLLIDRGFVIGLAPIVFSDIPARIYGNHFIASIPSEGWYLVGNRMTESSFLIKLYEWDGENFVKTELNAELQNIKSSQESKATKSPSVSEPKQKKQLIILVRQDLQNYWNENYDVYVKVFDKTVNPNPKFDDFDGAINNVNLVLTLEDPNGKKYEVLGQTTNNGFWHGKNFFPENISFPGKYKVSINADYGGSQQTYTTETFLFAVAPNRISPNATSTP